VILQTSQSIAMWTVTACNRSVFSIHQSSSWPFTWNTEMYGYRYTRIKFEVTKEAINQRRRDRQYNDQKIPRTNSDLQSITQKTKDRAIRTSLKTGGQRMWSGRVSSPSSTCDTRRVTDSLRVDILLHSDRLPSFQSNQSLLFLVNIAWLVEKPVNRCSIHWIITANSNTTYYRHHKA
jgi:outer membrane usher protein FimD/PapC